ncbi:MAG: DUF3006 domain-containing protein [Oscillospiraceae bacterium]
MKAQLIIDRFEGELAICEDENKKHHEIKRDTLPSYAKEGDVLVVEDGKYIIDTNKTAENRNRNFNLLNKLLKK